MADDAQSGPAAHGVGSPPPAPEEAQVSGTISAQALLVDSVNDAAGAAADATTAPSPERDNPPTPKKSATARSKGDGGEAPKEEKVQSKKREKTIDWGKFNHLCEHFALIYGTDTAWDGSERMIMKISNMGHAHGGDLVKLWKSSERRRTVRLEDVVFDPGMTTDPQRTVNLYDGMAMQPVEGNVAPMIDLCRYLTSRCCDYPEECEEVFDWLMCWLAYPLQNPGAKLRTAVIMHGDEGAGKNFLFDIMVAIYGKYGALVGQDELEDKFNDWRSCKMFVVGDEVSSRAELVHNKNRLKALITSPTVQINPKNLPRREERNHMNIVFLSNELQPLALDNSDRRYLVVYTPRAKPIEYYQALGKWRDEGGVAAWYHFLLHYPLGDFSPYSPAPMTDAKKALIGLNRKSPELFWQEWSGGELDLPYRSCSLAQAYQAYLKWCQRTGERYPFKREQFTPTLLRFAEAMDKPARSKVMKLDATPGAAKKVERMFLVCEPPANIAQGQWATECVRDMEVALRNYLGWGRSPGSPGDDADPAGGGF